MKMKLKNKVLEIVKATELNFVSLKEKYPIARVDRLHLMVRNDRLKDFIKFPIGSYLDVTDPKDIVPYSQYAVDRLMIKLEDQEEKGEEDDNH